MDAAGVRLRSLANSTLVAGPEHRAGSWALDGQSARETLLAYSDSSPWVVYHTGKRKKRGPSVGINPRGLRCGDRCIWASDTRRAGDLAEGHKVRVPGPRNQGDSKLLNAERLLQHLQGCNKCSLSRNSLFASPNLLRALDRQLSPHWAPRD